MNKSVKHIIFLTPGFAIDESDTYTIPALQLFFKEFKKQFNGKISIISFQFPREAKNYKWNGIDVFALGGNNSKIKKPIIWKKAKKTFKQLNSELTITYIHSFWMGECALVGSELANKYNLTHNCTLMGQDVLENTYFKKIKKLPQLISLSNFHANQLQKNHQLSSIIIPWGVQQNQINSTKKIIDLIVVSSLIPLKCVNQFIGTVALLKEEFPSINCKIIGDGPLRKELEQETKSLGLSQNIEFLRILTYNETQEMIAQSKILVHLSSFESFGMIVIEALALDTMVVAKPVGIANEITQVIKVNTVKDAAIQLQEILKIDVPKVACNYLIENTVKQYLKLVNE